jgi:mRNA-degrading endonuclease RelE of RelBE toxin-antitoxin system
MRKYDKLDASLRKKIDAVLDSLKAGDKGDYIQRKLYPKLYLNDGAENLYRYPISRYRLIYMIVGTEDSKSYIILVVPLIYFIFPFHTYFANLLSPFALNSPIAVSVIYIILFSATKQVGAFLFSLSFLIASTVVPKDSVRKSLLISCIGMTILFSCVEITPLQYKVLPPYGLIKKHLSR